MQWFDRLRGWTGLFVFAVVALACATIATRFAADAGERSDVAVTSSSLGRVVTIEATVSPGTAVREIVVRRDGIVLGRLLREPYRYLAVDLEPGVHRFDLEAVLERGVERHAVVVEIRG